MTIQKIRSGRVTTIDADVFVAPSGTLFFNESLGDLRLGDGITPGGILLNLGGGSGSGNYILPTATATRLGGVKIGSNITVTAGVISVAAPFSGSYADLSNKPTLFSGSYADLTNKPSIPSITGLATETYVTAQGYITSSALSNYALTSQIPAAYTLPTASTSVLGGIKLGTGLSIDANGVVNVTVQSGGGGTVDLTGYATETYVTTRGYLTAVDYSIITSKPTLFSGSYTDLTSKPTLFSGSYTDLTSKPTLFSGSYTDLTNQPSIPSITGLATETYVTTRGYLTAVDYSIITSKPTLFSGSYADLTSKPTLFSGSYTDLTSKPTLFDGAYASLTGKPDLFNGSYNNLTDKPSIPSITGLATETYVTTQGYITSSALTGYALSTAIPSNNNQLTNGAGYITSSALTGLATETYVTTRGYLTAVDYSIITSKPALFDGAYTSLSGKPTLFSGSYTDLTNQPSIPSITGLATETYVTTRGYLTAVDYSIITSKPTLFSGSYTDLTSKPTLFSGSYTDLTSKPTLFSGSYTDLTNKPIYGYTLPSGDGTTNQILQTNGSGQVSWVTSSATSAVSYTLQSLTVEQQTQARSNIAAVSQDEAFLAAMIMS
mgnify:CR=1 FL=1